MDLQTYTENASVAGRQLRKKWLPWLVGPLALVMPLCAASVMLDVVPLPYALVALTVILVVWGSAATLYYIDRMKTSRQMGLACPNCGHTLLARDVAKTRRCGKCDATVLTP